MLGSPISQTLTSSQAQVFAQVLAQNYLDQARLQKEGSHPEWALALYGQAKATFKYIAKTRQLAPALSEIKGALNRASTPQTADDEALRQRIAEVYFERAQLLEKLGDEHKAQASYKKAQAWGHPSAAEQSGRRSPAAVDPGRMLPAVPSSPAHADASLFEKNKLVDLLFTKTLETFQQCKASSVWPSAFLVYAHENPHVGIADAGTAKFLIHHLGELGVNLYSDQKPKGKQTQASFSTRADTARLDDILTSQLCLLPTAIGAIQPVDKVIVCGSQVLAHYLQWGEAGQHYQAYCAELKTAYGLAQQNVTQAEAEIRKVVNTYSKKADFHHVLTEMAFLKIRTDYLEQHGIIPVSLSVGGYESCLQDFIEATTVRIEDMARFASKQASSEAVYENQGRHLVFFKVLERLLAQHDAEALLNAFWTGYADWITRLNSESGVPTVSACLSVWDGITKQAQQALTALQKKVDANELRTALTRYASLDRLAIQRLSGPPLSMKDCYINLAVVEHERARKKEKKLEEGVENKSKEDDAAPDHFHRLPSVEAIELNQQKLISLDQLFESRKVSNDKTVTPRRILIRGRAGVGKTTLSKKIVYEYTQKGQWRDRFDYLLWIPLRTLKGKQSCDWVTLFYETYFQSYPQGLALAKTLVAQINGAAKEKTLFVLDGWDEVAQEWGEHEPMSGFLKQLLNQPAVLITSRPYVELKQAQPMDLELETVGFSPENVMAYLDNTAMMSVSQAQQIKQFIQATPFIQGLVNVPIQLDALCYSWDEIKRLQKEAPGAMTVTTLYQAMMNKLWRKDILRLGKREGGELLTASQVNALEMPSRIEKLVKAEQDFLSTLAFQRLQNNQIEFSHRDLHALIAQLEIEGMELPLTLEDNLKKLSFLHIDDVKQSQRSYQFIHLTFQEFFAAKHFVQHWEAGREIILLSPDAQRRTKIIPEAFVRQHKYNPRYEILWWFVAGLLRGEALNRFFILLEAEPRDLFGAHHQRLIMNGLHEASRAPSVGLRPEIREGLEQHLGQWLVLEIDKREKCTLAYQPTFPEHLLLKYLQKARSGKIKNVVATAFEHRSALSKGALQALIGLLYYEEVRHTVAVVLGKQFLLPESAFQALIKLSKDEDAWVRRAVAKALGQHSLLPESALQTLIKLSNDEDREVACNATEALGQQSQLPESALLALIKLLKNDENIGMARSAAEALNQHSLLPESILLTLIELLKNEKMRYHAADVLGKQSIFPESAFLALIALLKHKDKNVRDSAAYKLLTRGSLPESALQAWIAFLKDKDKEVKNFAALTLSELSPLPKAALQALIELLKDEEVRRTAAYGLAKQATLPETALQALIKLLKDEDKTVRGAAAYALVKHASFLDLALQALIELSKDEDGEVRRIALIALVRQSSFSDLALQALIALSKDKDREVRKCTADMLVSQSFFPDSAFQVLIALSKDEDKEVRDRTVRALVWQPSLPALGIQALINFLKDGDEEVRCTAVDALGKQGLLPESVHLALIELLKDEKSNVKHNAAELLGKQSSLPDSIIQALMELLKDKNWNVKHSAAEALGKQPSLPEATLQVFIELLKDENKSFYVMGYAAGGLRKQSSLPAPVFQALIDSLNGQDSYANALVATVLDKHRPTLYRLLPTLNSQKIELIYEKYLLKQRFDQSVSFYIQDGTLCFHTAEGLQTVSFSDRDQEIGFRQAVQQAQKAAGIPFAPYLSKRGQVEQPDVQNEEVLVVPSISQTQWGFSKTDRSIQTEVFPITASVNRSSSPHQSTRKKVLGFIKVNPK